MLTDGLTLVAAVDAVSDGVAERVLRQALATVTAEAATVASDSSVTASLVGAIGTLPLAVADCGSRQTGAVVTLERLCRTPVAATVLFIGAVVAVLVLVTHEVPGDALTIATLKSVFVATRVA